MPAGRPSVDTPTGMAIAVLHNDLLRVSAVAASQLTAQFYAKSTQMSRCNSIRSACSGAAAMWSKPFAKHLDRRQTAK
jgi:hypothetical protein